MNEHQVRSYTLCREAWSAETPAQRTMCVRESRKQKADRHNSLRKDGEVRVETSVNEGIENLLCVLNKGDFGKWGEAAEPASATRARDKRSETEKKDHAKGSGRHIGTLCYALRGKKSGVVRRHVGQ